MELPNQQNEDHDQYFFDYECDTNDGNNTLVNDFKLSLRIDGNSNPCHSWVHSYSGSYAMDARIRLEMLKSGSSSPVPTCTINESMYSYDFSKDIWEIGQNELSALDSVDLIDVDGKDEEGEDSWLYVSTNKFAFGEKTESALRWCRQVLDNRSPEMEAACLKLINRLNLKLSCESRYPGLQKTGTFSLDLPMDQTSFSCTVSSNSFDHSDHDMPLESSYKLQSIKDVYDVARTQEASTVYTIWCCFLCTQETVDTTCGLFANTYNHTSGRASVPEKHPTTGTEKKCLSPKVTRLHQYKMLKRAQNQGPCSRSSSPIRTSLRSLQAVRSSRSLDIDDYSLDQILRPKPGMSYASYRSSSHSAQHLESEEPVQSVAIKRCQRSHSLSPSRIPHPSSTSADRVLSPSHNLRGGRRQR